MVGPLTTGLWNWFQRDNPDMQIEASPSLAGSLFDMVFNRQQQPQQQVPQAGYGDPWAGMRGPGETLSGGEPFGLLRAGGYGGGGGGQSSGMSFSGTPQRGNLSKSSSGSLPATFSGRSVGSDGKVRSFDTSSNRWYTVG